MADRAETAVGQPQQSISSCYYELAMAVVRQGVLSYIRCRKRGYVRGDSSVNDLQYWDDWWQKRKSWNRRTMALNKAREELHAIAVDAEFYKHGIHIYLKILGYENQIEWLHGQVAKRLEEPSEQHSQSGSGRVRD